MRLRRKATRREPHPFRGSILKADQPRTGSILQADSQVETFSVGEFIVLGAFSGVANFEFLEGHWGYLLLTKRSYPRKYPQKQIDVLAFWGVAWDGLERLETGQITEKRHKKTASGFPETV